MNPLGNNARWPLRLWLIGVFAFLYLPLVLLIAFSFNVSKRPNHWTGLTLDWYRRLFGNAELIEAFANSLAIAALSTLISLVLGTLAALFLWRRRGQLAAVMQALLAIPVVVPEICLGVAFLVFFAAVAPWPPELPWPLNLGAIVIAHVGFSCGFVALVVGARLASFDPDLEAAARDLGATDAAVLRDILLPHLAPGLVAAALLAFTLSLDDFVITFFTSGPDTPTLPVKVYAMVRFSVTPEVNAASAILIVLTFLLTTLALRRHGDALARIAG